MTTTGRWAPGIGDPTWGGWTTVLTYVLAAGACGWAARSSPGPGRSLVSRLWWGMTAALVFLGINKQLDLQSWLTQFGRELARAQGWYDVHRAVQAAFIVVLGLGIVYAVLFALWLLRDEARSEKGAIAGLLVLGGFILMRAASFHHFDELLGSHWGGFRFNWLFENTGIAIIGFHAMLRGTINKRELQRSPTDRFRHGHANPASPHSRR